ncbi:hypothetical protein Emed_006338 [Eimeria media]
MSSFYGASGGDEGDDTWGPGGCTSLHRMHGLKPLSLTQILAKKKRQEKIVMCTAYDLFTARVADDAMVDLLLVGDSLANVVLGEPRTTAVDLDTMIMFAKLVAKSAKRAVVVFDLPYGTYKTPEEAAASTAKVVQATGIQLVKLEGHVPEVVRASGTAEDAEKLLQQALDLQEAGASLLILEMVCAEAAQLITENLRIPTIGIGAGAGCDGQVLVIHDLLGLGGPGAKQYKFVKRYANLYDSAVSAVEAYRAEVVGGVFPQKCNATCMKPGESDKFAASCARRSTPPLEEAKGPSSSTSHTRSTQADSNVSTSTEPCPSALDSSCESQEKETTRPFKVCVWGGGRMGQLIAWILAGPPQPPDNQTNAQKLSSWQQLQARGMEVSICTNRQDLLAASAEKGGVLQAFQAGSSEPDQGSSLDANKAKHNNKEGDCEVKSTLSHNGTAHLTSSAASGERRRVTVLSRKQAEELGGVFDLVIIACHSGQTQEVAESAFRAARVGGLVASLQNGLKAPRLLRALHDRQLQAGGNPPALVFMPTSLAAVEKEPLVIQQLGSGCVRICGHQRRSSQAAEQLYVTLMDRGIPCELLPHHRLDEMLWEKAAVNCFINPLTALLNCTNSQVADPRMQLARKLIVSEVVAVARGKGIPLTFAAASAAAHAVACATKQNVSSTLGQLREGRPVELADISGEGEEELGDHVLDLVAFFVMLRKGVTMHFTCFAAMRFSVVREASLIGLTAPANRLLLELVGVLEATRARCLSA